MAIGHCYNHGTGQYNIGVVTNLEAVQDTVRFGVLLTVGLDLVLAANHEGMINAETRKYCFTNHWMAEL